MRPDQVARVIERSCQGTVAGWIACTKPAGGVELFSAWFAGEAYQKHRHNTYAVGVTDSGVQVFDYRGSTHASTPGQVCVLYSDEIHDGRAGTSEGFGYRIVYVEPSLLVEAVRDLRGWSKIAGPFFSSRCSWRGGSGDGSSGRSCGIGEAEPA